MGINVNLIKIAASKLRYIPAKPPKNIGVTNPHFWNGAANETLVNFSCSTVKKVLNKTEVLKKYASEHGFIEEDLVKALKEAEKYLDDVSIERLLKLTSEGKIKLYEQPKVKRFDFLDDDTFVKCASELNSNSILSYIKPKHSIYGDFTAEEYAQTLKQLLAFEAEGKIPALEIAEILKFKSFISPTDYNCLLKSIQCGEINSKNIQQALLLAENGFSFNILNAKSLDDLSQKELKELANILASKSTNRKQADGARMQRFKDKICELDAPLLPQDLSKRTELLSQVSKKLTSLTKVNAVPMSVSKKFLSEFDDVARVFADSKHSIDDLVKAGGIKLSYPRKEFKQNILKQIEHLSEGEQNRILSKFGLLKEGPLTLSGLPLYISKGEGLSKIEVSLNKEINKFLNQNEIILPQGFEEFQSAIKQICEVFPEFKFAIGSIQHMTHSKDLANHILMVFQENMKNPLYKTLSFEDKRILGIATLLHDINKVEKVVDEMHPLISSQTVNSIVNRMGGLTNAEKNRIINFVENHHWLVKIKSGTEFEHDVVDELAYTFRKGNDFTLAKIFAESDLKAVNNSFFPTFGKNIQSDMVKAIENRVTQIQSSGKLIYTADITLDKAIASGAKMQILGEGAQKTENWIISAKDLGLQTENILYHAPGKSDAFILAESGFGYGNEGVLSCSLGRAGHSATFQNRKEFILFRSVDMGNISIAAQRNANSGADKNYAHAKEWILCGSSYGNRVISAYHELTSKTISEIEYAKLYQIASNPKMKLTDIHSNKQICQILGGEKEAKAFEESVLKINETLVSNEKTAGNGYVPEIVAQDLEFAGIGTNRTASEVDYQLRKRYPLIVEF